MQVVSWKCTCSVCGRPIHAGNPTLLFELDREDLYGIAHATCSYSKSKYGLFWMCPPDYLYNEQVSFLAPFFPRLYSLPGRTDPNGQLRVCLAHLLLDYPNSLKHPMTVFQESLHDLKSISYDREYDGDLETDYLKFLGEVQTTARAKPLDLEFDFRRH